MEAVSRESGAEVFGEKETHELRSFISKLGIEDLGRSIEKKSGKKSKKTQPKPNKAKKEVPKHDIETVKKPPVVKIPTPKNTEKVLPTFKSAPKSFPKKPTPFKESIAVEKPINKRIIFDAEELARSKAISQEEDEPPLAKPAKSHNLLLQPGVRWFEIETNLEGLDIKDSKIDVGQVQNWEMRGVTLLQEDAKRFQAVRDAQSDRSEARWLQTVMKSGTLADKIAAHTIAIQESAVHGLQSIKYLLGLLDVKGRRECLMAMDTLRQLLSASLLNPNAKLRTLAQQPLQLLNYDDTQLNQRQKDALLALWTFEASLKQYYADHIIPALELALKDSVDETRKKAISTSAELLAASPEQEHVLLPMLVNKVGDPQRTVATRAVAEMERILQKHPNMKGILADEIERLLYRTNVNPKAQYYGLCFLSQILLSDDDAKLAAKLIGIYFSFFKACVKKGEIDSKMMSVLLSGVKRAFPYAKPIWSSADNPLSSHGDTLFKLVHLAHFGIGIQALALLDQVLSTAEGAGEGLGISPDRFYSVLYRKLLDPELAHTTRQSMFLNLLFRALKREEATQRLPAFVKRLLQICTTLPPPLACGILFLISELHKVRPELKKQFDLIQQSASSAALTVDSDDEEHYEDVPLDEDGTEVKKIARDSKQTPSSWVHRANLTDNQGKVAQKMQTYEAMARNPLYARADAEPRFEALPLSSHFHPSVALFAQTLLKGQNISYQGDPLQDFTLVKFLDRFVFRNPKQVAHMESAQPPIAHRRVLGRRNLYKPIGMKTLAMSSIDYMQQPEERVPPDEVFFHRYFKQVALKPRLLKGDNDEEDDDVSSVASDEFDEYLQTDAKEEFDLDFASHVTVPSGKSSTSKNKEYEDEDDLQDLEADSDLDGAFDEYDDMLKEAEGVTVDDDEDEQGFEEENAGFSDGEEGESFVKRAGSKRRFEDGDLDWAMEDGPKAKKNRKAILASTVTDFADAEEFAELLEDDVASGWNVGGSQALSNPDRAHAKQLKWEAKRDRSMTHKDKKGKRAANTVKSFAKPKRGKGKR